MTYTLVWRPAQEQEPLADEPFDVWRSYDGDVSTMFHRAADGFYVRFVDCGDYIIDLPARQVTCIPAPDVPDDYCDNIFSNQILPLLWTYDGVPVLHASCVVIDGGAYGFLGQSGRGKSTMAAAMAHAGYAFLTDDGLLLERDGGEFLVRPYLASIRLLPDSECAVLGIEMPDRDELGLVSKVRVPSSAVLPHADDCAPLRGIYVLEEPASDEPVFRPLGHAAAIDALLQHSFLLDSKDKGRVRKHFGLMATLAESCPMYALDYPRDFARLDNTIEAIAEHARSIPHATRKGA
ncbi:hypothetical protein [Novosphingobium sp. CECT 9465]|uniref:hypothetical protein n=1 Tax=Novosphingobium sp. CECT 9465 TaxID=2829794 RepID=UPI001E51E56A|nr:hypothetical protein [Novosphingobium sp. CECT 9465]CAH0497579.1 hypothetical protein NVSP9465_02643 [Novosphingobium sp. CECT 9465]